jgi:hypothetical protein
MDPATAEIQRIAAEQAQLDDMFGGITTMSRFMMGLKECRLVRIAPDSRLLACFQANLFAYQKLYPFHPAQGWGEGVFREVSPIINGLPPAFFGVLTDEQMPSIAALIHSDIVPEIDPDAPKIVYMRKGWIAGLPDAYEHDTPPDVQALGDSCIEEAGRLGLDKVHIVTGVPPANSNRLLGRPFTEIARWKYRKQFEVIAAEIPLAQAA